MVGKKDKTEEKINTRIILSGQTITRHLAVNQTAINGSASVTTHCPPRATPPPPKKHGDLLPTTQ